MRTTIPYMVQIIGAGIAKQKILNQILGIGLVEIKCLIKLFNNHNPMLKGLWIIWNGFHLQNLMMLNLSPRVALEVLNQQFGILVHAGPMNHFQESGQELGHIK